MGEKNKLKVLMLSVGVIAAGLLITVMMIKFRKAPEKIERDHPGRLVEAVEARVTDERIVVTGTGTVEPLQEIAVIPQVSGKVVSVSPDFISGGYIQKGEILFKIEEADYRIAVINAESQVTQAEFNLASVESQARIARDEWEKISGTSGEKPNPLVLFEPQLKNARAMLEAARAGLEKARLDVERTALRAPFDCRVRSELVDIGQYVRAGTQVGALSGTAVAEIVVPLMVEDLRWLEIPRIEEGRRGSRAVVYQTVEGRDFDWDGYVDRVLSHVDPLGRMERVVVRVEDPFGLKIRGKDYIDLTMGSFVNVNIEGMTVKNVVRFPIAALRQNDTVWLAGSDGKLHVVKVEVLRRDPDHVLVSSGLNNGDNIITTTLTGVAEGMKIRLASGEGGK